MKRYFIFALVCNFLFLNFSQAQAPDDWVKLKEQGANLKELRASFDAYWGDKDYVKGFGWKQFKRFEHFWSTRVDERGNFPTGAMLQSALQSYENFQTPANRSPSAAGWYSKGPVGVTYGNGRINFIEVDPNNPNTIYIGSPSGGCWKTTDAGINWLPLTDFLSTVSVSGIAIDPGNSNNVLINTGDFNHSQGYSNGIFRSTDGGLSWNTTSLTFATTNYVRGGKIEFVPGNSNDVFAISHSGMYRSFNGGLNWSTIVNNGVEDFEFKPGNPSIMYYVDDNGFYKSSNAGVSFSNITNGLPTTGFTRLQVAVTPANPNVVYILGGGSGNTLVYKSTDSGTSFSQMHTTSTGDPLGGQVWYDMAFCVSPTNENDIHGGAVRVYRSQDGGVNFGSALSSGIHADVHWLEYFGNYLYCGNDGGIHRSLDGGSTWENLIGNLRITQFYKFSSAVTDTSRISAGAQDNGTYLGDNNSWSRIGGGDGMDNHISYVDKDIIYLSSQSGSLSRSGDGGQTRSSIFTNVTENGGWVTPMEMDPNIPTTIYAGYENVWKSTDEGNSSTKISNFTGMGRLDVVKVAPSNSDIIYATDGGDIMKTADGGNSWIEVGASIPSSVTGIEIHHTNSNIVWVTLSNYTNGQKIYKSIDGGLNWTNISGNLPNLPANTVVHHDGSTNDDIYIGMDYGVYFLDNNAGTTWQSYMTALPNVTISELEIPYGSNVLRAATFGRGVWESPVKTNVMVPPIASGTADHLNICSGDSIAFTNASVFYNSIVWVFPGGVPATSTALNPTVSYANPGSYDVTIIATNVAGIDTFVLQNYINVDNLTATLDLQEGFDGGSFPTTWVVENPDGGRTWETLGNLGGFGVNTGCIYVNNYSYTGNNNLDYFFTPSIDLALYSGTSLSFDVAYTPYSQTLTDTMAVYYSSDCGITLTKIWEKGNLDLSTTGAVLSSDFSPQPAEWRTETVNISSLNLPPVETKFYFENRGYYGNNLYVDNINIMGSLITNVNTEPVVLSSINVYPNPGKDILHVDVIGLNNHSLTIYDMSGKKLIERSQAKKHEVFNIQALSPGIYTIKIISEEGVTNKKFVKN